MPRLIFCQPESRVIDEQVDHTRQSIVLTLGISATGSPPRPTISGLLLPEASSLRLAPQNTDQPIRSLSNSSAFIPASEFPAAFSSGDHTQRVYCPGTTATMPPPTPLLPGKPTR